VPSVEDVRQIAAIASPVIRNLEITYCYSRLAAASAAAFSKPGRLLQRRSADATPRGLQPGLADTRAVVAAALDELEFGCAHKTGSFETSASSQGDCKRGAAFWRASSPSGFSSRATVRHRSESYLSRPRVPAVRLACCSPASRIVRAASR
jgi:hypothetical protein